MPTKNPKTERIKQRLEEIKSIKAAAKPAVAEHEIEPQDVDVPLTESDVKAEVGKVAVKDTEKEEEFVLDGAKFVWMVDGEKLNGRYRINDATITINDPVSGYTSSMPITLPLAVNTSGIGRLVDLEKSNITIPPKLKLRNGELTVSMAVPITLPRIVWRTTQRSVVWAIIQYMPTKNEWRVVRLRSAPRQAIYEAQQIMRHILGDAVYTKLKEVVELIVTPL